ncbi:hypothetical protein HPB47_012281 [Ixodes persulcatus]|uniref:Uncharacterized protein n=1 Tax=Ixodes persulcatus TaxID=34615 RepID=A0AC60NU01_IXOPE|nr:hypothetical protein HPB47_012281 [Ixodes persulcatus]
MENPEEPRVVDLRSDTITKPTPEMRQAMKDAVVGDDVFKEDPTVNELERVVAEMFGKEAALLVPTGTMGNLASVMAHCNQRGQEILVGDASHIFLNEQGNVAQIAAVQSWAVPTQPDGSLLIEDLARRVRYGDFHCPKTSLICLENTHNVCSGTVLSMEYLNKVTEFSKQTKIPVHMDGARIMNAATYLDLPVSELLKGCDSVMMCISKGLACPAGSLVAGSKDFVQRVARVRKALGGGMRQVGILAAAGLVALKTILPRLHEDHENTQRLARGVCLRENPFISMDLDTVQTNMAVYDFIDGKLSPVTFCERLQKACEFLELAEDKVSPREFEDLDEAITVKMIPISLTKARAVLHNDVSSDDVDAAITKIRYVVDELCRSVPVC